MEAGGGAASGTDACLGSRVCGRGRLRQNLSPPPASPTVTRRWAGMRRRPFWAPTSLQLCLRSSRGSSCKHSLTLCVMG